MKYLEKKLDFTKVKTTSIFDEANLWSAYFGQLLLAEVPLKRNQKILDVGCGAGFPLFELANRLDESCHLTGIDIWETAIKRAALKKEIYGLENISLKLANAEEMPFPKNHFDLIISNLGINNFSNPEKVSQECFRILKPGGRLILTTNLNGHMKEFYTVFEQVLASSKKAELIPALHKQAAHRGTVKTVNNLLAQAGFAITKKVRKKLAYRYLNGTAFLNHPLTVNGFLDGWRGILNKKEEAKIFSKLEKELNKIARSSGELKVTIPMLLMEGLKK